jgi:hypothetical protein
VKTFYSIDQPQKEDQLIYVESGFCADEPHIEHGINCEMNGSGRLQQQQQKYDDCNGD